MKAGIHPQYDLTTVTCSCGASFVTRTTRPPTMSVELCNECHPFYTGEQRLVDTGGRVEHFQRRYGEAAEVRSKRYHKKTTAPTEASSSTPEEADAEGSSTPTAAASTPETGPEAPETEGA
ncbi:MAG: 50S ribosomal protein L31 [Acidimicrobiia bacterium]|nr:50S ribosomal protein L31 [Acidimicrobiia bacterium]MYA39738.1 50S ribosomal protein L31 [Acidimicrobiia bacterium]MYB78266.1 50S ribosomal protein L31 [Acidimicrobiia bacterium]MYD40337.1 50S ribosomal protein L31 [Acidimicrobiia bacterium]MYH05278.1 50S ribosomal protein L31 [Acidimicrobiia bacterium]